VDDVLRGDFRSTREILIVDGRFKPIDFATVTFVAIVAIFIFFSERSEAQFLSRTHIVEGDEVKLGMSIAQTGRLGLLGGAVKRGCLACFARVNREGGISGRKLILVDYDDRYEPIEAVYNTERLIHQDKVFALLNFLGTPTSRAILPMISESNIVMLGPISGAEILRQPIQPYVFNTRASYHEEAEMLVAHLVDDLGIKRVALFRQEDSYGDAGHAAVAEALQRRGLQIIAEAGYVRNSVKAQDALYHIAKTKPDSVILFGTYKPCADFIRGAKQLGLKNTVFCNVSCVGTEPLANYLGDAGDGVVISQVLPSPYDDALPIVQAYQKDMQALGPAEYSYMSLEGYINGLLMFTALKAAGPELTEQKLVHSLESFDIDFKAFRIRFGPNIREGNHQVFLTKIERGKAVPIQKLDPADYGR
jgi:ABC-type branched-subunit amino acid transport system substrate-binding protein